MEIAVKNLSNEEVGKVEVSQDVFEAEVKTHLLHSSVKMLLTNRRRGTASAKARSDVKGSNRKPWAQKGTGRARAGSCKSPLWRGGGITFGPIPKNYNEKLPKKVKKAALKSALSAKHKEGELVVVQDLAPENHKTKTMISILSSMKLDEGKTLLVVHEKNDNVFRGSKNIPGVKVLLPEGLNVYDLLLHKNIVCTQAALMKVQEKAL